MSSFDPRKNRQPEGNNVLLLAALAAVLFMMGWDYFAPQQNNVAQPVAEQSTINGMPGAPAAIAGQAMASAQSSDADAASPSVQRIALESASLSGGVALVGGRIDELDLKNYTVTLEGSQTVQLLSPSGKRVQFFDAGWQSVNVPVPTGNATWQAKGDKLTPKSPLVLTWSNDEGQTFTRTFTMDEKGYTVRIIDEVMNKSNRDIQVGHYAQIHRADGIEQGGDGYEEEVSTFYNFIGPEASSAERHIMTLKKKRCLSTRVKKVGRPSSHVILSQRLSQTNSLKTHGSLSTAKSEKETFTAPSSKHQW